MDSCADIATLRTIEPWEEGQIIAVVSYYSGWRESGGKPEGGGLFVSAPEDDNTPDDGGSVIATKYGGRWWRIENQFLPVQFGCIAGGIQDCTAQLRNYIRASAGKTLIFQGGPWRIRGTLDMTLISRVVSDNSGRFKVDPDGFDGDYAITFGDLTGDPESGRSSRVVLDGSLVVDCDNRDTPLNGVYMKGQWFVGGHIRVSGFNGTGIFQDSVWDSTFERLSVERCGNVNDWALKLGSSGDTYNATHIMSIQCEQAYHRGISMSNKVRNVINNIHAERLIVLTTNDGTSGLPSGLTYLNHNIQIGNCTINQLFMDGDMRDSVTGQTPGVTTVVSMALGADRSEISNFNAYTTVVSTSYGIKSVFSSCRFASWYIAAPAKDLTLIEPEIANLLQLENNIYVVNPTAATIDFRYNGNNVKIVKGKIGNVSLTSNILGDIAFEGTTITGQISGTKNAAANYSPVTFNNCNVTGTLVGSYQSSATFNGGRITTAHLVSGAAIEFNNVTFGTFSATGSISFITRGCKATTVSGWKNPDHGTYPAGTINHRLGKPNTGDGIIYVNTDGATNWKSIATLT